MLKSNSKFPLILVLVGVLSHLVWFLPNTILNFSDWSYWYNEPVRQLASSWGAWLSFWNTGAPNIQIPFNVFTLPWTALVSVGASYDIAVKITFLVPIALLGFLSPYYCFKRLTNDPQIGFVVALFYGTTTYFLLRQTAHLPIAFVYSIFPLLFLLLTKVAERKSLIRSIVFALFVTLSIGYEVRIMYLFVGMSVIYFLFALPVERKALLSALTVIIPLGILLNAYWLLPTIMGGLSRAISSTADRGLFGNQLFDMIHAVSLHDSSWTGGYPDENFIAQPAKWYLFIPPMIASFAFFQQGMNSKKKRTILFFAFIAFTGIFLTKQSDQPIKGAYIWLYGHFPGFNLFREASKFYVLTAFGYAGLLAFGLSFIKQKSFRTGNGKIFYATGGLIAVLISVQLFPLVTGQIGTMWSPRSVPRDYLQLKKFQNNSPDIFFRTLWIPTYSRWGYFDNIQPIVSGVQEMQALSSGGANINTPDAPMIFSMFFRNPTSRRALDLLGIKYIIVPIRDTINDDDFFKFYGDGTDRNYYVGLLEHTKYLKEIEIGAQGLNIFINSTARPKVYSTGSPETLLNSPSFMNLKYVMLNPTEYRITLNNISGPTYVHFSESFERGWVAYVGSFAWMKALRKTLPELGVQYHRKSVVGLNEFYLSPQIIKSFARPSDYRINNDGSISLELTIFYLPQSYFFLGSIISVICIVLSFLALIIVMAYRVSRWEKT